MSCREEVTLKHELEHELGEQPIDYMIPIGDEYNDEIYVLPDWRIWEVIWTP